MTGVVHETTYRTGGRGVAWRDTGDEVVVLDLDGSVYFGINATGATLWKLLVTGATREQLMRTLVLGGLCDQVRAGRDVDDFLRNLDRSGLLQVT